MEIEAVKFLYGLAGLIVGILAKFLFDTVHTVWARDEQAKVLADALRGEVIALRDSLKQYRSIVDRCVADISKAPEKESRRELETLRSDLRAFGNIETPIYDANPGNVGLIWRLLARETTEFYGRLQGLKHFSNRLNDLPLDQLLLRLDLFRDECHALIWEATELAAGLNEFSAGFPYPEKRSRTANALLGTPEPDKFAPQSADQTGSEDQRPPLEMIPQRTGGSSMVKIRHLTVRQRKSKPKAMAQRLAENCGFR